MHGNEKTYHGGIERLRSAERVALIEPNKAVEQVLRHSDPGDTILDIGCGSGLTAQLFSAAGHSVSALDFSVQMLCEARKYNSARTYCSAAMEQLPFVDHSFDLLFYGLVLHETTDMALVLREGARIARKKLAILDWPYRDGAVGPPLTHRFTPEELQQKAHLANLALIETVDLTNSVLYVLAGESR